MAIPVAPPAAILCGAKNIETLTAINSNPTKILRKRPAFFKYRFFLIFIITVILLQKK